MASTAAPRVYCDYQQLQQPHYAQLQQHPGPRYGGLADGRQAQVIQMDEEDAGTAPFFPYQGTAYEGPQYHTQVVTESAPSTQAVRNCAATVQLQSPTDCQEQWNGDGDTHVLVHDQRDVGPPALQYVVQTRRSHKRTPSQQKKTCCRAVTKAMEKLEDRYQSYAEASLAIGDGPRASQRPYIRRPPPCVFFPALQRRAPEEGMYVVEMARKQLDKLKRGIVELPKRICGGPPRSDRLAFPSAGERPPMWRVELQPSVVYEGDAPELVMVDDAPEKGAERDAVVCDTGRSGHYVVSPYATKGGQAAPYEMQAERHPVSVYTKTADSVDRLASFSRQRDRHSAQQELYVVETEQPESYRQQAYGVAESVPVPRSSVIAAPPEITRLAQERGEASGGGVVSVTEAAEKEQPAVLHHHHYHYTVPQATEYEVAPVVEVEESQGYLSGRQHSTQNPADHYVSVQHRQKNVAAESQEQTQQVIEKGTSRSVPQTPRSPRNVANIESHEADTPTFYVVPTHTPRTEKDAPPVTAVQAFSAEQLKEYLSSTKPEDSQTPGVPTAFLISPIPSGSSIISRQPIKVHTSAPDAVGDKTAEHRSFPPMASVLKDGAIHNEPERSLSGQQTVGHLVKPLSDRAHRKIDQPKNFVQLQGSEVFPRSIKPASFTSVAEPMSLEAKERGSARAHSQYRVVSTKDALQESPADFVEGEATVDVCHPGELAYVKSQFSSQPIPGPSVQVQAPQCRTPFYAERSVPRGYGSYRAPETPRNVVYADPRVSRFAPVSPVRVKMDETRAPARHIYAGQQGAPVASAARHVVRRVPSGGVENAVQEIETTYDLQERPIVVQPAATRGTFLPSTPSFSVIQCDRSQPRTSVVTPQNSDDVCLPMVAHVIRSRTPLRRTSRSLSRTRDFSATSGGHRSEIRQNFRPATSRLVSQPRLQIVTDGPPRRPSRKWEVIGPL